MATPYNNRTFESLPLEALIEGFSISLIPPLVYLFVKGPGSTSVPLWLEIKTPFKGYLKLSNASKGRNFVVESAIT